MNASAGTIPHVDACFVEAIGDHLTLGHDLPGHVTDEGAAWLESRITRDGVIERATELELLLKLLERADSCPPRLHELARDFVSRAVLSGKGYEGRDPALVPGQIGATELELIRRTLFAASGAGDLSVTRDEAEWPVRARRGGRRLCPRHRMARSVRISDHEPSFAAGPSDLLERGAMLRRTAWLKAPEQGIGAFFARAFEGGFDSYMAKVRQQQPILAQENDFERQQVEAQLADALGNAGSGLAGHAYPRRWPPHGERAGFARGREGCQGRWLAEVGLRFRRRPRPMEAERPGIVRLPDGNRTILHVGRVERQTSLRLARVLIAVPMIQLSRAPTWSRASE